MRSVMSLVVLAVCLLALLGLVQSQASTNTMIFIDNTFFYSVTLPMQVRSNADPHIYNTATTGSMTFSLDWNGDAGDTFNFVTSAFQSYPTGTLAVVATPGSNANCSNANTFFPAPANATTTGVGASTVTLTTNLRICNYTASWVRFAGTLAITYNPGFVPPQTETVSISFLPSTISGDPQFVGLRGQSYQVHGIDGAVYNLISEPNTQVNSRFVFLTNGACPVIDGVTATSGCWSHAGSYMGDMSFQTVVDGKLHAAMVTAGSAKKGFSAVQMDGKPLAIGETVTFGAFSITHNSTHSASVTLDNFAIDLSNSDMFLNLALIARVPLSHLESHGLIGQTHSTKTHKTAIKYVEGDVDDYLVTDDDLFGTDFPFNQFQKKQ